jgi:hypothetical protein
LNPKKLSSAVATAVVLISLSGLAGAAGGTYYRWVDASGTEVNSDRPPPAGIEYETVSTNTNLLQQEAQPEAPATAPAPSVAPEEAQGTAAPAGSTNTIFQKNPEYCEAARKNLETLSTHARIRLSDAEGNIRYIDEKEKAEQRATAEAIIAQHCE